MLFATMELFLAVILEERRRRCCLCLSTSNSRPQGKNIAPAQNAKSNPISWNVYMQE